MTYYHHRLAIQPGQTTLNRAVVGEATIATHLEVVFENQLEIVVGVGTVTVPRHLHALPRSKGGIDLAHAPLIFALQLFKLGALLGAHAIATLLQMGDALINLGEGALKIEIVGHKTLVLRDV